MSKGWAIVMEIPEEGYHIEFPITVYTNEQEVNSDFEKMSIDDPWLKLVEIIIK
jgi:hypothetical protein